MICFLSVYSLGFESRSSTCAISSPGRILASSIVYLHHNDHQKEAASLSQSISNPATTRSATDLLPANTADRSSAPFDIPSRLRISSRNPRPGLLRSQEAPLDALDKSFRNGSTSREQVTQMETRRRSQFGSGNRRFPTADCEL